MNKRAYLALFLMVAIAATAVPVVVATDVQQGSLQADRIATIAGSLSPDAGPHLKTLCWWVNGIRQPPVDMRVGTSSPLTINAGDTIMFTVKCSYTGPGNGYMYFRDEDSGYQESVLLPGTGKIISKKIIRSFMYTSAGSHNYWITAFGPGSAWGSGDPYMIYITVI